MTNPGAPARWIARPAAQPEARLRLICLPYAGGGATIYRAWPRALPKTIEVCAIQLPARELRVREPPYTELPRLVADLAAVLEPLTAEPFAIFGHSMGALIGFELARELRRRGLPDPRHLFVAGYRAPQLPELYPAIHQLPDDAFISEVGRLDGTPREVLEHAELLELVLPILRADFALVETYAHQPADPLSCPVSAFGGLNDPRVSRADLDAWRAHAGGAFALRMFPGDHFFIRSAESLILQYIRHDLAPHLH